MINPERRIKCDVWEKKND